MSQIENDPLSTAAGGIEAPRFPVLAPDRVCRFRITKAERLPVKDKPDRELLALTLKTEADYPDSDGKTLHKGFPITIRTAVTPTTGEDGKRPLTLTDIAKELAMWLKGCGLTSVSPRQLLDNPSVIVDQIIDCKTSISPEKNGFAASNRLRPVIPA